MRLLVAVGVLAVTGEAFAAPSVLDGIEVVGSHAAAVRLRLSAPAVAQARSLPPSGDAPDRIYIDLAGTTISPTLTRVVDGAGPLLRVRAGQFDRTTARVVLDLSGAVIFTVQQTGQMITIQLGTPAAKTPPPEPPKKVLPPPVAAVPKPAESARAAAPSPPPPAAQPKPPVPAPAAPTPATKMPAAPAPVAAAAPSAAEKNVAAPEAPPPSRGPAAPAAPAVAPPPAAPPAGAASAPPRPTVTPDDRHGGEPSAPPVVAPAPPPKEAAAPLPQAPAENRPAAIEAPAPAPAVTEPAPQDELPPPRPPALPSLFPSMGALPGAMIALRNGREPGHGVPATPPRGPAEATVPATPRPADPPAAVAAAPPPPVALPQAPAHAPPAATPPLGPPAPPAALPEPTRMARAMPVAPPEPAKRPGDLVPPPPERPPQAARATPRRPAPRTPHPLVVLDAGHGGRDPGAAGVGGVLEKDVVLDVTRLVARRLAARLPVDVLMTRSDDSFIPIERRLALPSERATLFISLHANACSDPTARGLEVFYGGGAVQAASTRGGSGPAALLGRCLDEALEKRIGGVRGGARPGTFGVLVRNPVPSALIEIGYLTHPGEAARTQDTGFHELLADALVDGVAAFLRGSAPPL